MHSIIIIITVNLIYSDDDVRRNVGQIMCAVLLLEIIPRNILLQNIVKAFTLNFSMLMDFGFFILIILFLFGSIGYYFFNDYFLMDEGALNQSFLLTITTTIKEGLRRG